MIVRDWSSYLLLPGLLQSGCLDRVKGANGIVNHRDGALLCRIEGEQRIDQRPGRVVGEVRIGGLDKVPGLEKTKKVRVR